MRKLAKRLAFVAVVTGLIFSTVSAEFAMAKHKTKKTGTTSVSTPVATATPVPVIAWDSVEQKWLTQLGKVTLGPRKVFSFRKWMGQQKDMPDLSLKSAEKIASLLYQGALKASLIIGDRTPHTKQVDASSIGFDVSLKKDKQDLTFMNQYTAIMSLNSTGSSNVWTLEWSAPKDDKTWTANTLTITSVQIASPIQLQTDIYSAVGVKTLKNQGVPGLLVKIYGESAKVKKHLVSRDFYAPTPTLMTTGKRAEDTTITAQ